ncbi:uncharacterized protein LOC120084032 [Benincasa hispida]|uniref:uncharacterized protein LOC120084032 n=1 Tax=Benincasa hispida TaxID=102211 RepID=UPI0019010C94|nr:uncharacterized protein LOC120084032 [Benincasa hispida]
MRQIVGELMNRPQGTLPSSTELPRNLGNTGKEHCQAVTLRSGKAAIKVRKKSRKTESKEQPAIESRKPLSQTESKESETREPEDVINSKPPDHETLKVQLPPFPQRLKNKHNDEGHCLKEEKHGKIHHGGIDTRIKYYNLTKDGDPGSFTIPCSIGGIYIGQALCDLGVSINLMLLSIFKRLNVGQLTPTTVTLQLADRSLVHPEWKLKDVLITIDRFILPADFIILDYEADKDVPIILG